MKQTHQARQASLERLTQRETDLMVLEKAKIQESTQDLVQYRKDRNTILFVTPKRYRQLMRIEFENKMKKAV